MLAPDGVPKWLNDAAIAIAQAALRNGTCDRQSIPPPEGVFQQHMANPLRCFELFIFL